MTVSSTLNKIIYPGNASQTAFPFTFSFPGGTATQEGVNIQVFFTSTLGVVTQLIQGAGAANYQISFNPATGTNPTPAGGTVTYNPPGGPIALGTFLTILRVLPLTQSTSLANQGTLYQPVEEGALDYNMMVSQQVLEIQSRALVVNVSDPAPSALPAVSARANLFLAFDVNGNPIASQPGGSNTPVSSVMVPVVTASTLAAARTALGLGSIATGVLGLGLGSVSAPGAVDIVPPVFGDAINTTLTTATHTSTREALASITYSLPQISTTFNGFFFTINTRGFSVTVTPNATDSFDGMATGASLILPPGTQTTFVSGGTTTWFFELQTGVAGFNAPTNLQFATSVASSALTIALKDRNGLDPTPASPIIYTTSVGGSTTQRAITTPLSITVPNGASLGTVSNQANRIWIGLFDNSGTPVLGVYNSYNANTNSILSWNEWASQTGTAISAGSTNPQTWYTSTGVTLKALRIIGYLEATQPTAGAWTVAPSVGQLFGPGIRKPGETIQEIYSTTTATDTTTSATFVNLPNHNISITAISACNLVRVDFTGLMAQSVASATMQIRMSIGTANNTNMFGSIAETSLTVGSGNAVSNAVFGYVVANSLSSITYAVQGNTSAGTLTLGGIVSAFSVREIQI